MDRITAIVAKWGQRSRYMVLLGVLLPRPAPAQAVAGAGINPPVQVITGVTIRELGAGNFANIASFAPAADGTLYFTDGTNHQVGMIQGDTLTKYPLSDADPNNLVFPLGITVGLAQDAWFTYFTTNSSGVPVGKSGVGHLKPGIGIDYHLMPTGDACRFLFGLPACGITAGFGRVWYVGSERGIIGEVSAAGAITEHQLNLTGDLLIDIAAGFDALYATDRVGQRIIRFGLDRVTTTFPIPGASSSPWDIEARSDGAIAFASTPSGIGWIPPGGSMKTFEVPTAGLTQYLTWGSNNKLYLGRREGNVGKLGELDPATRVYRESPGPEGLLQMRGLAATGPQDKTVLFMNTLVNGVHKLYRAEVPKPVTPPTPDLELTYKRIRFDGDEIRADVNDFYRVGDCVEYVMVVKNISATPTSGLITLAADGGLGGVFEELEADPPALVACAATADKTQLACQTNAVLEPNGLFGVLVKECFLDLPEKRNYLTGPIGFVQGGGDDSPANNVKAFVLTIIRARDDDELDRELEQILREFGAAPRSR